MGHDFTTALAVVFQSVPVRSHPDICDSLYVTNLTVPSCCACLPIVHSRPWLTFHIYLVTHRYMVTYADLTNCYGITNLLL